MGRKHDISDFLKGQVVTLNAEGYSQCSIPQRLPISRMRSAECVEVGWQ